jgi:hypothetical protein
MVRANFGVTMYNRPQCFGVFSIQAATTFGGVMTQTASAGSDLIAAIANAIPVMVLPPFFSRVGCNGQPAKGLSGQVNHSFFENHERIKAVEKCLLYA